MTELPNRRELRHQVREIQELGTLPHVMARIQETVADESAGARELGLVVAEDQSLTGKILKVANSAFYGRHGGVATVADAIVLLGFSEVRQLALAVSVIGMFERGTSRNERRLQFWMHCFHAAALAEIIARDRGAGGVGAFTGGLLHDVGRMVLDQFFPAVYRELLANEEETGRLPADVEEDLLGCSHGLIGFWLAEQWRFPDALAEAIRFHHTPSNSLAAARLTAIIHIADALAHRQEEGEAPKHNAPREIHPYALAQLDLVPSTVGRYLDDVAPILEQNDALVRELIGFTG